LIKEAIEKIEQMTAPTTFYVDSRNYSSKLLHLIPPVVDKPVPVRLFSLDGVVKMIRREAAKLPNPLFIHVKSQAEVDVFSTYGEHFTRCDLCKAEATGLSGVPATFIEYADAMIKLRSIFQQNEGTEYLLGLLSSITDNNSVTNEDNGMSQTVQVRQGIALVSREMVKPRVALKPYRTFLEVDQPESEFLVRVLEGGKIGFFEADGGMWKLTARVTILNYLTDKLGDMVESGVVEIMI
jgi:hypothetical protein